jgi:hypothetical protein
LPFSFFATPLSNHFTPFNLSVDGFDVISVEVGYEPRNEINMVSNPPTDFEGTVN